MLAPIGGATAMLKRVGIETQLTFIGGVARQGGIMEALRQRLGVTVHVPDDCDTVCALGAALLGLGRRKLKGQGAGTGVA